MADSAALAAAIPAAAAPRAIGKDPMDKLLSQLVGKLQKAYGDRLISVVLYGSAATGDHQGEFSDYQHPLRSERDLRRANSPPAEEIFRWWREQGSPSPLLLTEQELATSTDCFAIEFHDIQRQHRLLHGKDVITPLRVDDSFYRAQVEHELRAKLLRATPEGRAACSPIPICCAACCSIRSPLSACFFGTRSILSGSDAACFEARRDPARQRDLRHRSPRRSKNCSTSAKAASSRANSTRWLCWAHI